MPYRSQAQAGYFHTHQAQLVRQGVNVAEWDRATKGKHLPKRVKKKKVHISVNNKLKEFGNEQGGKIEINVKKHKGNKSELADTIHHEILHAKHPKAKEAAIKKKTHIDMSNMSYAEKDALTKKVRMKKFNYKLGAAKRRFKISASDKVGPGDLIKRFKEQPTKTPSNAQGMSKERLAILGLI